jgi:hypothetical protein
LAPTVLSALASGCHPPHVRRLGVLFAAVGLLALGAACAPPGSPPYELYITATFPSSSNAYTDVYGTVENLTNAGQDYEIEMLGSTGEAVTGYAWNVFPGDTAIWSTSFTGQGVTPGVVRVLTYLADLKPVNGDVAITYAAASSSGQYTDVSGTVRNAGPTQTSYEIELRAVNTGETETGYAFDVQPGQIATWTASFRAGANIQWVRTTTF